MKLKVGITAQNRKTISEHAGKCRNFFIYDIDNKITNKYLLELTKEEVLHEVLHTPNSSSLLFDLDILLTRGIGYGAIQKLARHNVTCYKIEETDPDKALEKLLNGTLEAVAPVGSHSCNHDHENKYNERNEKSENNSCGCH